MSDELPANACRLFAHYEDPTQLPAVSSQLVVARLLEEGDSSDLRWLTSAYPESQLSSWLDRHGSRLLSHRSRSFWRTVLARPDSPAQGPGDQLWPL